MVTLAKLQKFIDVCKLVSTIQTSEKFRDFEEPYFRYFSTNHKSLFFQDALSSGERFWVMQELVNFLLLLFLYIYSKTVVREEIAFVRRAIEIIDTSEEEEDSEDSQQVH